VASEALEMEMDGQNGAEANLRSWRKATDRISSRKPVRMKKPTPHEVEEG
jgi:hypothetical protein